MLKHFVSRQFAGFLLVRRYGTPLETIMGIMRHADIRETLIYAPYDLTEGKKAILTLDD